MSKEHRSKIIIIVLFVVGLIIHYTCTTRPLALQLTTPFLFFINAFIIYNILPEITKNMRVVVFLVFAFGITISLEIIGTLTGEIFGSYTYGNTLQLKVASVPVIIGINWVILLMASYNLSVTIIGWIKLNSWLYTVLLSAFLLTFLDYFIEPVAIKLDYWNWKGGDIPLSNYVAWFVISLFLSVVIKVFKLEVKNKLQRFYYIAILCYFVLLNILLRPCLPN